MLLAHLRTSGRVGILVEGEQKSATTDQYVYMTVKQLGID